MVSVALVPDGAALGGQGPAAAGPASPMMVAVNPAAMAVMVVAAVRFFMVSACPCVLGRSRGANLAVSTFCVAFFLWF
ncbi:hypothetical protein [Mycolicibacterium hippocampi]|uniref:hypothetical protein n=1 Tax=Mycolicibacterium hippocampi TaxID=659824 RepID=UPI0021F2AC71|nr:hypothetical protein [Mycolicibacterium hippocampi]